MSKAEGVDEFTPVEPMLCEHRAVEALARETEGRVVPNPAIELAGSGAHDGAPVRIGADAKGLTYSGDSLAMPFSKATGSRTCRAQ